jgi:D-xylose transport system substrate-binding protein
MTGAFLGLATILSVGLTACGSTSGAAAVVNGKNCMKVGILLPESDTSARWEGDDHPDLVNDITKALPGVHIDYANANGDSSVQQQQAETELAKGDCILVLAPHDSQQAATIVDDAKKDNVPVISYDRLTYNNNLNYYVSFDNVKVGELQGQYIADNYKNYVSAGHANIAFIDGAQTDNNALLFSKGAHNILDPLITAGTLNKVYEQFTPGWTNSTAQTEMEGALTANSNNIQIAYVANDGMAGTVIAALTAQHLNGKVLVTGQDATVAGIQQIILGNQNMTVYKPIPLEAQATADLVAAISKGNSTASITNGNTTAIPVTGGASIPSVLETPKSVDITNIASTVIADGFVKASDVCSGLPAGTNSHGICPGS